MTRTSALWLAVPEEIVGLILVLALFGFMFGFVRGRTFLALVAVVAFLPLIGAVAEEVLAALPPWVALAVLVAIVLAVLRAFATLLIGGRAADHMIGALAANAVWQAFRLAWLPVRAVGWIARGLLNGMTRR
jgi:hypothetical protein